MIPMLEEAKARASTALEALSTRERTLLLSAAGLGVVLAFSTLVWKPLGDWRRQSLDQLRLADSVMARVGSKPEGARLRIAPTGEPDLAGSAASAGLALQSLEPEGDGVRVKIQGAPYAKAMTWIASLEQQRPGRILSARLEKTTEPGLVDVDLLLAGPAS